MVAGGNWNYLGGHFLMYENVESLWYIPETNDTSYKLNFNFRKLV